ncbi:MAG: hypothetical protein V4795_23910, partial [Pseudomonadota bacterium]
MSTPIVTTDLEDYAPSSTAFITASGFSVGSAVMFQVQHVTDAGIDGVWGTADDALGDNSGNGHTAWYVIDGGEGDLDGLANGVILTSWYVDPDDSLGATFRLTASGSGGDGAAGTADDEVATDSFTDAVGDTNKIYQHWADQVDQPGGPTWQGNILSEGKSDYFEGEVIPHVFVYKASNQTPLTNGASYSFNITYNYYQANTNAGGFAYITTYNISRAPGPNDATDPYIAPSADAVFANAGGTQGIFHTVDANITNVSAVSYSGSGTKDGHVTVTFTYTGATTTNGLAEIYYGLYIANPGQVPNQGAGSTDGANAWTGGSLQTTVDIGGSGATSIQLAPDAIIVGEISGLKFNDLDGDGMRDLGEPGLAGWTIFLDQDNDGVLDLGESSTVTGAGGAYSFSVTPDADKSDADNDPYMVREVNQAGWTQTTANPAPILITALDPTETNVNFGNQQQLPSLSIDKTVYSINGDTGQTAIFAVGEEIVYRIAVDNDGNVNLTGVTVTDQVEGYGVTNAVRISGDDGDNILETNETWIYQATYTVVQADFDNHGGGDDDIDNVATADSAQTDPPESDSAAVPINPGSLRAELAINKAYNIVGDADQAVDSPSDDIVYTVTVTNNGTLTLTNVVVSDPLAVTLANPSGTIGVLASLDVGASQSFSFNFDVTQAHIDGNGVDLTGVIDGDGDIDNTATATSDQDGPESASAVVPVAQRPSLNIVKDASVPG